MTDSIEDGNYLVRVRAQVMSRDDSSGGWVPLCGGGLSNVSVRKRPRPAAAATTTTSTSAAAAANDEQLGTAAAAAAAAATKPKHDYLIYGKRISDNAIILSCTIKKDFEYNKVMPTFHHWKTGDKKFGLTFQAAADARAFDKGVRTAVEDLLDGYADTSPVTSLPKCTKDVGDDDVFMTLDLPQDPKDSRSSSDSSTKGSEHLPRIAYIGRDKPLEPTPPLPEKTGKLGGNGGGGGGGVTPGAGSESYPYVQLTAVHEYIYPAEDQQKPALTRAGSGSCIKKPTSVAEGTLLEMNPQQLHQPPILPPLKGTHKKIKIRCRYCHELYTDDKNPRGSCEYAPDLIKSAIERITCISCAECIGYHCASDEEGDFAHHPCDCHLAEENCTKRWICLTFLSVFVPCLWLYPPLKLCHWCGVKCGVCGGRHAM